jgi:hypothetical protein
MILLMGLSLLVVVLGIGSIKTANDSLATGLGVSAVVALAVLVVLLIMIPFCRLDTGEFVQEFKAAKLTIEEARSGLVRTDLTLAALERSAVDLNRKLASYQYDCRIADKFGLSFLYNPELPSLRPIR